MPFGPIRRGGWDGMQRLRRRCVRHPVFRTLAGSVVVCDAQLARRVLADTDEVLEHIPAFWRPGGVALPQAERAVLNRWVHRSLAEHDVDRTAKVAVDMLANAHDDLHRSCLHAVAAAVAGPLATEANPELGRVVAEFLDTVFLSMVTGDRRSADEGAFARLSRRADAALAAATAPALPELPGDVAGEIYLRAVSAFVGATSAALGWLICVFQDGPLVAAQRSTADLRDADPMHVALETLRLWPPAWQHRRPVRTDHRLGPVRALRGDDVVVPTYALHRHPAYWAEAEVFDPGRWAGQERSAAFLPFATGPGACVGATFEVRWLTAAARHMAARPPLPLTRTGSRPCVTAILSPPRHRLR
jgi:cytochrome P450